MAESPAITAPVARTLGQSIFIPPGWVIARAYLAIADSAVWPFVEAWSAATLPVSLVAVPLTAAMAARH